MNSQSLNSISIRWNEQDVTLPVPVEHSQLATDLSERFVASIPPSDPSPTDQASSTLEAFSNFIGFLANEIRAAHQETAPSPSKELLQSLLRTFETDVLNGTRLHIALQDGSSLSDQKKLDITRNYYAALSAAEVSIDPWNSDLLKAAAGLEAPATIYAIFGGQGLTDSYFDDLRTLYSTYRSLIEDLIRSASEVLQSLSSQVPNASTVFANGLDVLSWLEAPETLPSKEYLLSAPISFPLIGLLQLATYQVTCKIFGILPGDLSHRLRGITGHSQGIVTAVAISVADTWETWTNVVKSTLTILFWIGVRSQQVAPLVPVSAAMLKDSANNGEGTPTPMLNIRGLSLEELQKNMAIVNRTLRPGSKIGISLINSPRNFVISGPPVRLYGLCRQLRKVKATAKSPDDADKIMSRYLPVSVPFHSEYLQDATNLLQKDLEGVTITSEQLNIPVFSTKTGLDIRGEVPEENIVPELCRLITRDLLDWPKASEFPRATHILDFGPGGAHGIGSLTSSNKNSDDGEARVRVILVGTISGKSTKVGYQHGLFSGE